MRHRKSVAVPLCTRIAKYYNKRLNRAQRQRKWLIGFVESHFPSASVKGTRLFHRRVDLPELCVCAFYNSNNILRCDSREGLL